MAPRIRPIWPGAHVVGPAYPVECTAGDNLAIHVAVAEAPAGSVLVVGVGAEPARGYWGEVLATAAQARGIVGLVIDGGVRDVDALAGRRFGVFATMLALRGATKQERGRIGAPVVVGDVVVSLGDWVYGDADGVVALPRDQIETIVAAAHARTEKEQQNFAALAAGKTTLDLLSLDPSPIEQLGDVDLEPGQ